MVRSMSPGPSTTGRGSREWTAMTRFPGGGERSGGTQDSCPGGACDEAAGLVECLDQLFYPQCRGAFSPLHGPVTNVVRSAGSVFLRGRRERSCVRSFANPPMSPSGRALLRQRLTDVNATSRAKVRQISRGNGATTPLLIRCSAPGAASTCIAPETVGRARCGRFQGSLQPR